ncbi:MAG: hypothetical protein HQK76_03295 [Desulfobacterales bacterium]|nr:hypothetical protein [Desulfobacterales bacterium]
MKKSKLVLGIVVVFIIAAVGVYFGIQVYANSKSKNEMDDFVNKVKPYTNVVYDDVSINLLNQQTSIKNLKVSPVGSNETTLIDEVIVSKFKTKNDFPTSLHVEVNGIHVTADSLKDETLKKLGYDKIKADMELKYVYDDVNKELAVDRFSSGIQEMGTINISFNLGNISIEKNMLLSFLFTYTTIEIKSAEIKYVDNSFMTKLLDGEAKKANITKEQLLQKINDDIDKNTANETNPFVKESIAAVKAFIKNPKKLSLSISPKKPVTIGELQALSNPSDVIELLQIKISS